MKPRISYLVCGTPRSGSTFFSAALLRTGVAGIPDEYFDAQHFTFWCDQWGVTSLEEYVPRAIQEATTPNGVCGITLHRDGFLDYFVPQLQQLPQYHGRGLSTRELLDEVLPNLHYIWITRRNKVRQAVSLWKAMQTGQWVGGQQAQSNATPVYDYEEINTLMQFLTKAETSWQDYFTSAQVKPLTIVYEDLVIDYSAMVRSVFRYLGLDEHCQESWNKPRMVKQADDRSESWVQQFYAEKSGNHWSDHWSRALNTSQPPPLAGLKGCSN